MYFDSLLQNVKDRNYVSADTHFNDIMMTKVHSHFEKKREEVIDDYFNKPETETEKD